MSCRLWSAALNLHWIHGVYVHVSKRCKWEENSNAWNTYANSNNGYWPHWESVCAYSRVPSHPQHFWMTNRPTNRMRWVEPSVGGLLSYNQSLSVGLSLPVCATVASGKRKWGIKEGWKRLRKRVSPLTLGLNRQTHKEWARRRQKLKLIWFLLSLGQFPEISRNVYTRLLGKYY